MSKENLFHPSFPMDQKSSYFCYPKDFYGVVSNTITHVDQSFFESVEWKTLCARFMCTSSMVIFFLYYYCKGICFMLYFLMYSSFDCSATQFNHQVIFRAGREYSKELEGYKGLLRMKAGKINVLEYMINESTCDLERSCLSHAFADVFLHQASKEYGKVFEQKEALMLDMINKGKWTDQLQKEVHSIVTSYKESKEFDEVCAYNFLEGLIK